MLKHHSPTYAIHYLVPVRPRRLVQYNLEELKMNAPTDCVLGRVPILSHSPFSLTMTSIKLLMETKVRLDEQKEKFERLSTVSCARSPSMRASSLLVRRLSVRFLADHLFSSDSHVISRIGRSRSSDHVVSVDD